MSRLSQTVLNALAVLACVLGILLAVRGEIPAPKRSAGLRFSREDRSERTTSAEDERLLHEPAIPFREVYRALANRSRNGIAELAEKLRLLSKSPANEARLTAFYRAWATLDPDAAFADAKFLSGDRRKSAFEAVIGAADPAASAALVQAIKDLPAGLVSQETKSSLLAEGLSKWSQFDPVSAAQFLDANPAPALRFSMAESAIASNWAALDPMAAIAWARSRSSAGPNFALSSAVQGWWKNHPQAAEQYIKDNLATLQEWQLAGTLAATIFHDDPAQGLAFVSQLPNEDARRQASSAIAISWSVDHPAAAAQWAANLPPGEQKAALDSVMGIWSGDDPQAAGQWLTGYAGEGRDAAVESFSLNVAAKDPASALTWAATISDPAARASAEQKIAAGWIKLDRQAATDWIQNSSLPAAEKAPLLSPSPGR